ncbi:MAG TPA: flagellar export chaperone FliS [Fimbriimonadaceae bacterium]|nr:flagellar export chaperone FliS [Fimbriimonadaceae bacterium]
MIHCESKGSKDLAYGRFVQEYQKGAVNGASPVQLVIMLYDGALRFMEAGKYAMAARDLEKQNTNLQKAQKIIMELMSCLDMQNGGDIAKNLLALYTFAYDQLVQANIKDEPGGIENSIQIFSQLRESWVEIEKTYKAQHTSEGEQRAA